MMVLQNFLFISLSSLKQSETGNPLKPLEQKFLPYATPFIQLKEIFSLKSILKSFLIWILYLWYLIVDPTPCNARSDRLYLRFTISE